MTLLRSAKAQVCNLGTAKATKVTMKPGASWELCAKPLMPAGTEVCPARHVGFMAAGSLKVQPAEGETRIITKGDNYVMEPGHLVWVEGNEDVVMYEIESKIDDSAATGGGITTYASDASGTESAKPASLVVSRFDNPSTKMEMPAGDGNVCVCMMGSAKGMQATLNPGWTWVNGPKKMLEAQGKMVDRCPARHVGIIMQGKFEMTMLDSGAKVIAEPGQCYVCEPGHHAAVVGDEPVVFVEFESKL